eukprot:PhF_6_TR43153/c0_g1_i1/m.66064
MFRNTTLYGTQLFTTHTQTRIGRHRHRSWHPTQPTVWWSHVALRTSKSGVSIRIVSHQCFGFAVVSSMWVLRRLPFRRTAVCLHVYTHHQQQQHQPIVILLVTTVSHCTT